MKSKTAAMFVFVVIVFSFVGYKVGFHQAQQVRPLAQVTNNAREARAPIQLTNPGDWIAYDARPPIRRRSFRRAFANATVSTPANLTPEPRAEFLEPAVMNDYRMRWERQLRNPVEFREPVFNPSATERLFVP
jgi:hypothetical protein